MNERIRELAKQCRYTYESDRGVYQEFDEQKFAELIVLDVRRLMKWAADDFMLDKNYNAAKGVGRCMRMVREHFGVEE